MPILTRSMSCHGVSARQQSKQLHEAATQVHPFFSFGSCCMCSLQLYKGPAHLHIITCTGLTGVTGSLGIVSLRPSSASHNALQKRDVGRFSFFYLCAERHPISAASAGKPARRGDAAPLSEGTAPNKAPKKAWLAGQQSARIRGSIYYCSESSPAPESHCEI